MSNEETVNVRIACALERIATALETLAEKPPVNISVEIPREDSDQELSEAFKRYAIARNEFGLSTDPGEYNGYSVYSLHEMAKVYEEIAKIDRTTMEQVNEALSNGGDEE